ncbi:acyl-CoA dehydrogenase family protein [Spongorhabdus nitratireducens]
MRKCRLNSDVLAGVLAGRYKPHPLECANGWKKYWRSRRLPGQGIERALVAGAESCSPAWALASGYQLAVQALLPDLVPDQALAALCVNETGGSCPKAIEANVVWKGKKGLLNGFKTFVTGGELAEQLFVAVNTGDSHKGKPCIALLKTSLARRGVSLQTMFPLPFAPELPHASIVLEDVPVTVADILPGEAWQTYIDSFRTVEDLYIMAAMLGHMVSHLVKQEHLPTAERGITLFMAMSGIECQGYGSPLAHIGIGGCMKLLEEFAADAMAAVDPRMAAIWQRDLSVIEVASRSRDQRRRKAWYEVQTPRLWNDSEVQGALFN